MDFRTQKMMRRFLMSLLLLVAMGTSASALSLFEGRIGQTSKASGLYDLRLQFWNRPTQSEPRLFQTIEIPRVPVKDGRFAISLDAGLGSRPETNLTVKIQVRAFESWKPFEPAEVSRCEFVTEDPQAVSAVNPGTLKPTAAMPLVANTPPF